MRTRRDRSREKERERGGTKIKLLRMQFCNTMKKRGKKHFKVRECSLVQGQ